MGGEVSGDNQFVVTWYGSGGEHSDNTRNFDSYNAAMAYAWHMHSKGVRVVFRSRKMTYTPWKVHTISEPDHY